jgi:hypothetical protein
VKTPTKAEPFVPLFMINSWFDIPSQYHQIVDMICARQAASVPDSACQTPTRGRRLQATRRPITKTDYAAQAPGFFSRYLWKRAGKTGP